MKKIYFPLLLMFFLPNLIYSQQLKKNELYTSYGFAPVQEIASAIADILVLSFLTDDYTIKSSTGPIILGYRRNLSKPISIGLKASYMQFYKEFTILSSKVKVKNSFTTVMANGNVCINPSNIVQLYAGLSAGVSVFIQSDSSQTASKTIPAFQINALGIRVGNNIGGFVELGFGYDGLINGGFSVKF